MSQMLSLGMIGAGILTAFLLSSCARDDQIQYPAPALISIHAPQYEQVPPLSDADRALYCFTYVPQDVAAAPRILEQLRGTWKHFSSGEAEDKDDKWFRVSANIASMDTDFAFPFPMHEEISFNRACVSAELETFSDGFVGYRIVELMADNNEGGAAFAVKFDSPDAQGRTRIWMTDYHYDRWASTHLLPAADVVNGRKIYSFWKEK